MRRSLTAGEEASSSHSQAQRRPPNHRGITLLSIPGKRLALILLRIFVSAIRSRRRIQQAGFMPGRSTIDQIFALRQIIEKCNEHNRTLYIAFLDVKAAFYSIDRISLWDLVRISGTPQKLCRLLELLYSDSESCVRVGNDLSGWFFIASGVRQGCVVAPTSSIVSFIILCAN